MKRLWLSGALLVAAAGLAGCNGDGGGDSTITPPVTPPQARFEDQFGPSTGFGTSYRASANTEPRDVTTADVSNASPTTEPVSLP